MIALPSLQQLRFFLAVAEQHHFGRAAVSCGVTQSTLSTGIQELEGRLGVALIERSRRGVVLTAIGEAVLERARRLLADAEDLAALAQSGREPLTQPLRLGVIPTIGPYLVPAIMRGLGKTFPKLQLYLREEQTAPLLAQLADGKLDLVLLALPYATEEFETMPLGSDPIEAVLPKDHPHSIAVSRTEFRAVIERVAQFADERSRAIRVQLLPGEVKVLANLSETGESEESVPVEYDGPQVEIGFNAQYLLDFLKAVSGETVEFRFRDAQSAGELRPASDPETTETYRYVIMPMRI